ncbi:MAG: SUMF1/EgtB/PvdO family nonheme iron enzyme, partial [Myxococcales bacterium]
LMDLTEVTVSAYASCVTASQCATPDTGTAYNWGVTGKENHPINGVSSIDANTYCTWVGKRLPTEEEWEYAARYDDGRDYPWGSTAPSATLANYNTSGTTAVGSFLAGNSKLGMQDLAGNVWEWTSTWYCSTPPCTGTSGTSRVLRGGCAGVPGAAIRRTCARPIATTTARRTATTTTGSGARGLRESEVGRGGFTWVLPKPLIPDA